jgi:HlyD family secretion protein
MQRTLAGRWAPPILLLALLASPSCRRDGGVPTDRLVRVELGPITRGVIAVGRVEPRTRVEVKSKANGILVKLHVDVNDAVHNGQVIAELDREILQARVGESEGKLQRARARVDLALGELRRLEVEKTNPEFAYSRKTWDRTRLLYEEGVASEEERDIALERFEKAQYTLSLIEAQLQSAKASLASAQGEQKEMEALADLARQELKEATIISPIDGVVLYRYLEEGDSVSSIRVAGGNATVIMSLGDLSELYVDAEVDEVDVGRIISKQSILPDLQSRLTIESFKGKTFSGKVARITPLGLEDANGIVTFEVRIVFDNPERLLLANMTANALIVLEEKPQVLKVSQGALLSEHGKRFALVFDPASGETRRQQVEVGISDGSQVEITSGLTADQEIVVP